MNPLYSTTVVVEGGRNGIAHSTDGNLKLSLSLHKEFGGDGKPGTNPEQLIAAGYAACFESTLRYLAGQNKTPLKSVRIEAKVDVLPDPKAGHQLATHLKNFFSSLTHAQATTLVSEAQKVCPYHKMINGNIKQKYEVILE
ncbi:MAG: Ohr family peroxiredoxin [Bacteriovoracaceae bacterium]|nr:Ohr family peroxiredoxin [Bacteriovoracaceae bacterium]